MNKIMTAKAAILLILINCAAGNCWECEVIKLSTAETQDKKTDAVESILKQLNERTSGLQSYQAKVEYLFDQPLLESKTLRTGVLYFEKTGKESKLRIDFETLKQDEEKEQKYNEQYIFDGVWLTHIDYQIKTVKVYQMAEANKPADAFDLAARGFPIIGFTKTEELKKEFKIQLAEQKKGQSENLVELNLEVKPTSRYKDDYISVDFWINKEINLPARIVAETTEEDIYDIKFSNPKVNGKIDKNIFEFEIPKGYEKETIPLQKEYK